VNRRDVVPWVGDGECEMREKGRSWKANDGCYAKPQNDANA
jgi:hypothetical protein